MANGTQTARLQFKPRSVAHKDLSKIPVGEWDTIIPKGRCKADVTPVDGSKGGDPYITIVWKLVKAVEKENDSFQGAEHTQRITYYDANDPDRRAAAAQQLRFATEFAKAHDLELSDVYPDQVTPEALEGVIEKIEGLKGTIWTAHRTVPGKNGEEDRVYVDTRFRKPGSGLKDAKEDEAGQEERGNKRGGRARR